MSLTIPLSAEMGAASQMAACNSCILSDLYANLPPAGMAGRLYFPTDANIFLFDDGKQWKAKGPTFSGIDLPIASQFTGLNESGTVLDFSTGLMVYAQFANGGSNVIVARLQNMPAPPFQVAVQIACNLPIAQGPNNNPEVGIFAWDSVVGKGLLWGPSWRLASGISLEYQLFTAVNTGLDGPFVNTPASWLGPYPGLIYQDDGVNRKLLYSSPDFNRFGVAYVESRTATGGSGAAFTPNQVGIGINPCSTLTTFQVSVTVYSFKVRTDIPHG